MADLTREQEVDRKLALIGGEKCDKYDYLIAVACGSVAGLVDIFFVGSPKPGESLLQGWTDEQVDKTVMAFAKKMGWNPTYTSGERAGQPRGVASAIGFLENGGAIKPNPDASAFDKAVQAGMRQGGYIQDKSTGTKQYTSFSGFHVNYDQRKSTDVDNRFTLAPGNHHLKSLGHSPDVIGLFFSILDQLQDKSTFIADGRFIRVDVNDPAYPLRGGDNFIAKIFCGFCNWLGHLMSDVAGSSGGRGAGTGRGSGIAIPFYELFGLCDFGSFRTENGRQTLAEVMESVFGKGYDFRFGLTMSIPVALQDLFIRAAWVIRQHFIRKLPWKDCIPNDSHANLRFMLITGNATLCLFDGVDALARCGGNAVTFFLRLNIVAWGRLVRLAFKEICIQFDFSYADMAVLYARADRMVEEYLERLRRIDYPAYQQELAQMHDFDAILADDSRDTAPIYAYLEAHGANFQFHSFEEFDAKMQDPDFVLEI